MHTPPGLAICLGGHRPIFNGAGSCAGMGRAAGLDGASSGAGWGRQPRRRSRRYGLKGARSSRKARRRPSWAELKGGVGEGDRTPDLQDHNLAL